MSSSLKTASYIVLSFILWSRAEATDQDPSFTPSKHLSAQFSENPNDLATIAGKRKREDDLEKIGQPNQKRAKLDKRMPTQCPEIPEDTISVIAEFIEDPITFQRVRVVAKSWNRSVSNDKFAFPSDPEKTIKWITSFQPSTSMQFNIDSFFADFIARNQRIIDAHLPLYAVLNSFNNRVPPHLKLINDKLEDLSPRAFQLIKQISEYSSQPESRALVAQSQQELKEMLLAWQPYGICLHLNHLLLNKSSQGFESMTKKYPEIEYFLLTPYQIPLYPQSVELGTQFAAQSALAKYSSQIATAEAFKAYHTKSYERFYEVCFGHLFGYKILPEVPEASLYSRIKKQTSRLKEEIKRFTAQQDHQSVLLYWNQLFSLLETNAQNLKEQMAQSISSLSLRQFNITSAYHIYSDYYSAHSTLINSYYKAADHFKQDANINQEKGLRLKASDLYIQAVRFMIRYIKHMNELDHLMEPSFDEEDKWINEILLKAADCVELFDPRKATELREKAEIGADLKSSEL